MSYRGKERHKSLVLESTGANLADLTATTSEINALDGVTASAAAINQLVGTTLANGITVTGSLVKITETVAFGAFTGVSAVGTYDLTAGNIPAGAYFLGAALTAVTGFAGDTSAVLTLGDGTDADRYNTGSIDVFTTAATGLDVGVPSGSRFHPVVKTPKITITTNAAWASVSAGSVSVALYYIA